MKNQGRNKKGSKDNWCEGGKFVPHVRKVHEHLKLARLPIPPPSHSHLTFFDIASFGARGGNLNPHVRKNTNT